MRRKIRSVAICFLLLISIFGAIDITIDFISNVKADVLYVGGTGGGNYSSIQAAIDDADDGDTVFVYQGTYYENLEVKKKINLSGESRENTIIDGRGFGDVVHINRKQVDISGFTITGSGSGFLDAGIEIEFAYSCRIINNNISLNANYGILLYFGGRNIISANILYSNSRSGICLYDSTQNKLSKNIMIDEGISIIGYDPQDWNSHTIETSNTVNGKPVYYWRYQKGGTVPLGAGQVILANCTDVIVHNQNISNTSRGIQLGYSSNNIIKNNTVSASYEGIVIDESSRNNIVNNTILNCLIGIVSDDSKENNITDNALRNNDYGIFVISSDDENIKNNTVSLSKHSGILIYRLYRVNVIGNYISNNSRGIEVNLSSYGDNIISNNFILDNEDGIFLIETENDRIFENHIINNSNGIYICDSAVYNEIYNNSFSDNFYAIHPEQESNNNTIHNNTFFNNMVQVYTDTDGDGVSDFFDEDDDNDGHVDENDDLPTDPTEWEDTDRDGIGNNADDDDDNDGFLDDDDEFPKNSKEWSDMDGDGIGDNSDLDNNGNDIPDFLEIPLAVIIVLIPVILLIVLNRRMRKRKKNADGTPPSEKGEASTPTLDERNG